MFARDTGTRALLLLLGLTATACATTPPAAQPDAMPLEEVSFTIRRGDAIVATEQARLFADRIESEIEVVGQAHVTYVASYAPDGLIGRMEAIYRPERGAQPRDGMAITFSGENVRVERLVLMPLTRSHRTAAGSLPYLHPSPLLLEQIVRRAVAQGGDGDVPIWLVSSEAANMAHVRFESPEIAEIRMSGSTLRVWMLGGRLVGGEVPALGWVFHRDDAPAR
jgi:hypothetical protein